MFAKHRPRYYADYSASDVNSAITIYVRLSSRILVVVIASRTAPHEEKLKNHEVMSSKIGLLLHYPSSME